MLCLFVLVFFFGFFWFFFLLYGLLGLGFSIFDGDLVAFSRCDGFRAIVVVRDASEPNQMLYI